MARPSARHSVRLMFRTIVIGYDGPERGGDAVALAEILRDPRKGTLVLTAAYSPVSLSVGGLRPAHEMTAIRDSAEASLTKARAARWAASPTTTSCATRRVYDLVQRLRGRRQSGEGAVLAITPV